MSTLIKGSSNQTVFTLDGGANYARNADSNNRYAMLVKLSFAGADYAALSSGSEEIVRDGATRAYLYIDAAGSLNARLRAFNGTDFVNVTHLIGNVPRDITFAIVYDVDRVKFFVDGLMIDEQTGFSGLLDAFATQVPTVSGLVDGYDYVLREYATFDQSIPTDAEILSFSEGNSLIADFAANPLHAFKSVGNDVVIDSIPATFGGIDLIQTSGDTEGANAPRAVLDSFDINAPITPPETPPTEIGVSLTPRAGFTSYPFGSGDQLLAAESALGVQLADDGINADQIIEVLVPDDAGVVTDTGGTIGILLDLEQDATIVYQLNTATDGAGVEFTFIAPVDPVTSVNLQPVLDQLTTMSGILETMSLVIDNLSIEIGENQAAIQAVEQKVNQLMIRNDMSDTIRNTYSQDGSRITNSEFTLTKVQLGDGTFRIDKS